MDESSKLVVLPLLQAMNSSMNSTIEILPAPTSPVEFISILFARRLLITTVVAYLVFRCLRFLTSELPPLGSGLKRLPGPRSTLPYIGRVHDVDRMYAWNAMYKFSKEYDGLFACTLGGETHIWVARDHLAQDLLCKNADISSARADLGSYPGVTTDFKYLPLLGFTETWSRQRKFAHMMMTRSYNNKYYGYIGLEMKRTLQELATSPENFFNLTSLFCARISARFAYGTPDMAAEHAHNAKTFIGQLGPSGPVPNLLPPTMHLPEFLVPGKQGVRVRQEEEAKLWGKLFAKTKVTYKQDGFPKTYVGSSLEVTEGPDKLLFENEEEAKCAVGMLCTVAIFTIGGPAVLFIMAMILHPEWQEKVRKEIDEVVGEHELLDMKHSPQLPMLRAAIKECVRWKSTVPLGVPRLLEENYIYEGYHFPKGAVVHVMDIAMSQDPKRYQNPTKYDPNRWLDESSPNFKAPLTEHPRLKGHHIFGRGKRMCPGQDLAEAELLVFCGNVLKFFTLSPKLDEMGAPIWPDPENWTTDVIGGPKPFDCKIEARDSSRLDMVNKMYDGAFQ